MKKQLLFSFISFLILINIPLSTNATHYMGGEITWECIPAGQADAGKYIFQMKVYRECAGISFGSTQTLISSSPAGSFTLSLINGWPKDISPVCNSNPNFQHITCAGATTPNQGAIQEYIYRSQPIKLNGTPPAAGWIFYWGSCCRNPATNIYGTPGWRLRAIMYAYGTHNMYPCFDDSPVFAEAPQTVLCAGYPNTFNYHVWDKDLDSLSYEWGEPLQHTGQPLTSYTVGYSYQNPLPDSSINANNIAGTVNIKTGEIAFTSFTTGAFVTSVKVTAFKAGIKVAEIWRDMQIVVSNCGTNTQPQFNITYANGQSVMVDTIIVNAGDSILLNINAYDSQLLPNGKKKTLEMRINGKQFGAYIPAFGGNPPTLHTQIGCITPPCATLSPAPSNSIPINDSSNVQTQFRWQTECGHVHIKNCCNVFSNIYRFTFMAKDDFCPIPATKTKDLYIKVIKTDIPKIITNNIHYNYTNMTADFSWQKFIDPDSIFIAYDIFHSNSYNGPYTLIDSIKNRNQIVYSHNIGIAQQTYYYLRLRALACNKPDSSVKSNILSLDITHLEPIYTTQFELFQNEPNPANGKTKIRYSINKTSKGKFQLLDISGRIVLEQDLSSYSGINEIVLETSQFSKGIYYYRVDFGEASGIRKLIIY